MNTFISLGIAIIAGIFLGKFVNKFKIPAVAGYIIAGLIIGVSGFNIVDNGAINKLSFLSDFALGIIAFNIGSELKVSIIKKLGKSIFIIATFEALGAFIFVFAAVYILTSQVHTALILGAVASATAPAATVMVLKECKAKGELTTTLMGVVAVDDAICLMIFAIASSVAKVFISNSSISFKAVLVNPVLEIVLSILFGMAAGFILTCFVALCKNRDQILSITIGMIILTIGFCTAFKLSSLLSSMSLGIMVANICPKDENVFNYIEKFSAPVISTFFVLAGCRLNIALIPKIGIIGVVYFIARIAGKISGASIGGVVSKASKPVKKYLGLGLLSQVGVAVGLAITVSTEFKGTNLGTMVITILLATTIITELIGPVCTKHAIIKAGEFNKIEGTSGKTGIEVA